MQGFVPAGKIELGAGRLAMFGLPEVSWGAPLALELAAQAERLGARRILPVVTGSLSANDKVRDAVRELGSRALPMFTSLREHTPLEVVLALVERIREEHADVVVAVGGGSATDAAKIATAAASAGVATAAQLLELRAVADARGKLTEMEAVRTMPLIAVPTTLSGAEFGIIAGGTDIASGVKHLFRSARLAPDFVHYDPYLSTATPSELWLSTGIRALDHGIETILSIDANPFTDALAQRGIALLCEGLRGSKADPSDISARTAAQLGVWLCGAGIGRVRYGASHGIGHQLGAAAGVPHGITSCVLLPAVLAFNEAVNGEKQKLVAAALGQPEKRTANLVREFIAGLGLPVTISSLGLAEDRLGRIAETSVANAFVRANPRPLNSASDILEILRIAY